MRYLIVHFEGANTARQMVGHHLEHPEGVLALFIDLPMWEPLGEAVQGIV